MNKLCILPNHSIGHNRHQCNYRACSLIISRNFHIIRCCRCRLNLCNTVASIANYSCTMCCQNYSCATQNYPHSRRRWLELIRTYFWPIRYTKSCTNKFQLGDEILFLITRIYVINDLLGGAAGLFAPQLYASLIDPPRLFIKKRGSRWIIIM